MSVRRLLAQPLIWLIRGYQLLISPLTPPTCRYYPSCSAYAVTALERFGPLKGGYLAAWRLLRCNPWSPGGVDHVPPERQHAHHQAPARGPTEPPTSTGPGDTGGTDAGDRRPASTPQ